MSDHVNVIIRRPGNSAAPTFAVFRCISKSHWRAVEEVGGFAHGKRSTIVFQAMPGNVHRQHSTFPGVDHIAGMRFAANRAPDCRRAPQPLLGT